LPQGVWQLNAIGRFLLIFSAGGVEASLTITARTLLDIENRNSSSHFVLAAGNLLCLSCTAFSYAPPPPEHPAPRLCTFVRKQVNRSATEARLAGDRSTCLLSLHVLSTPLSKLVLTRQIHATTLFAENEHRLTRACNAASASQMKTRTCTFGLSLPCYFCAMPCI